MHPSVRVLAVVAGVVLFVSGRPTSAESPGASRAAATLVLTRNAAAPAKRWGAFSPLSHPQFDVFLPTGGLVHDRKLFEIPGGEHPFDVVLSHLPGIDYDGPFGRGVWSTLSGHLVPGTEAVTWFDERAAEVKFTREGGGFASPDGCFDRLELVLKGRKVKGYRLSSPGRWARLFDAAGRWTGLERPDLRVLKIKRLADHRPTAITTPEKRTFKFKYGKDRRLCSIQDWVKRLHAFGYDASGRLVEVGRPRRAGDDAPVKWTVAYDAAGRIAELRDGRGNSLGAVEYDGQGRVAEIRGPGGDTTFDHDTGSANTVDAVGRDGFARTFEYDASGRIVRIATRLLGGGVETETYAYDAHSRRTMRTNAAGDVELWTYLDTSDPRDRGNVTRYEQRASDHPARPPKVTTHTWLSGTDQATSAILPDGSRTDWEYDARGWLRSLTLPSVLTEEGPVRPVTTYAYDALGRLVAITRPGGSREVRVWGKGKVPADFLVSRTLDAGTGDDPFTGAPRLNDTTRYEYDAAGNVIGIARPGGGVVRSAFDAWDRMTAYTNELGHTTRFVYDAEGNAVRAEAPFLDSAGESIGDGVVTTTGLFDAFRNVVRVGRDDGFGVAASETFVFGDGRFEPSSHVDARGTRTEWVRDAFGRVLSRTRAPGGPDESTERYEYDARGRVTRHEDPVGRVTTTAYDGFGCVVDVTDPAGHVTRFTHDARGRPVSRTILENGTVERARERYEYDGRGNLVTVERDRFTSPAGPNVVETTQSRFDERGFLVFERDARGCTTRHTVDALGRVVRTLEVELDRAVEYRYDARGNIVRRDEIRGGSGESPVTRTQLFEFDAAGRLVETTEPDGTTSTFENDSLGQVVRAATGGVDVRYEYDANGRLRAESRARGGDTITSSFQYDAVGNLVTSIEGDGRRFDFEYDGLNRTTRAVVNGDDEVVRFEYDAAGQVTRRTGLGGDFMDFTYDPRGYLLSRTASTGEAQTFAVNAIGVIAGATDTRGGVTQTNTFAYDSVGNAVSDLQNGTGPTIAYGSGGVVTGLSTPNGMEYTVGYDAACRVSTVTRDAAIHSSVEYVEGTHLPRRRAHPRMNSDFEYDEFDRTVGAAHSTTEGIDSEWTAEYGANGRLVSHDRDDGTSEALLYDEFGRLTRSDRTGAAGATPRRTDIAYAPGLDLPSSLTLTPASPAKSDAGPKDFPGGNITYTPLGLVDAVGTDVFTYDTAGRATNWFENRPAYPAGERKVKLDAFGRVIEVRRADDTLIASYRYDAFDRPVVALEEEFTGAQILTRQRVFFGCTLLFEFAPGALPGFDVFYVPNFAGSGHVASGFDDSFFAEHLWQEDCNGEPRQTYNLNNGKLQERYDRRDAWGQVHFETTSQAGVTSPFRGAPSLQSLANLPGLASSYCTGLQFSWGLPPLDPFLPRPLTADPGFPGGGGDDDPPPRPHPYRPEPHGLGNILNPLPRPDGARISCDASLAKLCRAIDQMSRTADKAARCSDQLQSALDRIAQETEAIRAYQQAAADALQGLADQKWFLEALQALDSSLQVAQIGAKIRSVASETGAKLGEIAKRFQGAVSRVKRGIMGSLIAQEQAAAVGELVGEAASQGVEAAANGAVGQSAGDAYYGGENFSLPGRLGLAVGQLLRGSTFEGDAAELQAQIFTAQAGEALARSQIRQQQEALERLAKNKKVIAEDAAAACANYEDAKEGVAAWPGPRRDEKEAAGERLKAELSARGVR